MSRSVLERLFDFLDYAHTSWHAVAQMAHHLRQAGYTALDERAAWALKPGGRYYTTRDDGALIAFQLPTGSVKAFRMIGAHTDSPHLRLKPAPFITTPHWIELGVEVYGGALLAPWFDRDLGIAGRVLIESPDGQCSTLLVDSQRPVATIPSLAIHLDREANKGKALNPQTQMNAIIGSKDKTPTDITMLVEQLLASQGDSLKGHRIIEFELGLYDSQPAAQVGLNGEFFASARLDNLLSCFCGLEALLQCDGNQAVMFVANDHEEVGSGSPGGAQGTFLDDVLTRIHAALGDGSAEGRIRLIQQSCMISCDNAHGLHPNFADRHDAAHAPVLNQGPVIKYNANERYATTSRTAGLFKRLCAQADVPVQVFSTRADMGCGSTIGPLTATALGIATLDVGLPQWAMHSIRETAGSDDPAWLIRALVAYCNTPDDNLIMG